MIKHERNSTRAFRLLRLGGLSENTLMRLEQWLSAGQKVEGKESR
jgi:hypothetical protein